MRAMGRAVTRSDHTWEGWSHCAAAVGCRRPVVEARGQRGGVCSDPGEVTVTVETWAQERCVEVGQPWG